MTKNKIKTIVMVVAIILALTLAGGWIAQTVINKKKQQAPATETASCFIVTPENDENGIMALSAELYAATNDTEDKNAAAAAYFTGQAYSLTANVLSFQGNDEVTWDVAFLNPDTAYATGNSVENYIQLIQDESNTHNAIIKCLQPFMEQIVVKAAIKNNPQQYATCVCDYEQRYIYRVELGDYTFRTDGVIEYTNGKRLPVGNVTYEADLSRTHSMGFVIEETSTLYTKASTVNKANVINFFIEPTSECISMFGDYDLPTYTNKGDDIGDLENFLDIVWAQAQNGDYSFIEQIAETNIKVPLYQLRIMGAPSGEVCFDLYFNFIFPDDLISINTNQVTF